MKIVIANLNLVHRIITSLCYTAVVHSCRYKYGTIYLNKILARKKNICKKERFEKSYKPKHTYTPSHKSPSPPLHFKNAEKIEGIRQS